MSWLRVDDGFADHPKLGKLTDPEFRVWMRILCYCAKYRDPTVDESTVSGVKGLDDRKIAKYEAVGLLDPHGESLVVHDWLTYAPKDPTGTDRQARWRASHNGKTTRGVTP